MAYKDYNQSIYIRVALIVVNAFILTYFIPRSGLNFNVIFFLMVLIIQVRFLVKFLSKNYEEVSSFLNSIKYDDFSQNYSEAHPNPSTAALRKEFNEVMNKFREVRAEKEANYQYFKTIVQHVGIGILTFKSNGEVQMINAAAKRLFNVGSLKNVSDLNAVSPALVKSLKELKTGGRELIKLQQNGNLVPISIYVIELAMQGDEFKLVSLQNIQSELEEKEMEAWQNLIRILTHEIMNSVTPISSLAATVDDEILKYLQGDELGDKSELEDIHLAVKTIQRRSEGLIRFVSDFRNLSRIPNPKINDESLKMVLDEVCMLMRNDIEKHGVKVDVQLNPSDLQIPMDKQMVEQVLINLLQNALHALDEKESGERKIEIIGKIGNQNRPEIIIRDNGPGIEEEALARIFIPFFTTKKQGSGIGLSISKQIMRKHNGTISVVSKLGEGTEFTLRF
jgi:two-component system nitrogen regulation sensor histidine kinase NtrY